MARTPKKATARPRKKGDDSTNARKRYYRAAERNLKKARESSGATAARYRELARQQLKDAINTYDPANRQKLSQPIRRIAQELGYDLGERLPVRQDTEKARERQQRAIKRSENVLESRLADEQTRAENEARAIVNSPIGSRIIGGLVDVWRDKATDENGHVDKSEILKAVMNYMKVDSLAGLLQKLEEKLGDILYKDPGNESIYENVKILLQTYVANNTLVE